MKDASSSKHSSNMNVTRSSYDEAIVETMPVAAFAVDDEGEAVQFNVADDGIARTIKEVLPETNKAVEAAKVGTRTAAEEMDMVDEAGKAFGEILLMVPTTSNEVDPTSSLMDRQKEGTQTAAKAVDGIASISEESASSTEEMTARMEDMNARAQSLSERAINLKKVAGRYKCDGGVNVAAEPHAVPRKDEAKGSARGAGRRVNVPKVPEKVKDALGKKGDPHSSIRR